MPETEVTFTVETPLQKAWDALSSMEHIAFCVPEVKDVQVLDEKSAVWTLDLRVGFLAKTVKMKSKISALDPPRHAVFDAETQEGDLALSLSGTVDLSPLSAQQTEVTYRISIEASGVLSGMLNDLIRRKIDKDTDKIVGKLKNIVVGKN